MAEFIVHMFDRDTWRTATAEGPDFATAAVAAAVADQTKRGLDLPRIPHTVEFREQPNTDTFLDDLSPDSYLGVVFRESEPRRVFDPMMFGGWGMTRPGDVWFSVRVREGKPGDSVRCAGSGVDPRNPFVRCHRCGDGKRPGGRRLNPNRSLPEVAG